MKKLILLFLLFSAMSFGQNKLNAFAGANYSYFTDGIGGQILAEESFGLQIGASYEIKLNEKIAFRPGLVFSQIGDRTKTDSEPMYNSIDQMDIKLSYINIPMDFKFWNKIYLVVGPQIGILVSQKKISSNSQQIDSGPDFGFNLGTGFTINRLL